MSEQETIICWLSTDDHATVDTMHQRIISACQKFGAKEIRQDEGIRDGKKKRYTFLVPPEWIKIRPKKRVSEAQRERMRTANPQFGKKSEAP